MLLKRRGLCLRLRLKFEVNMKPDIKALFDKATWTLTYVIYDPATHDAVVIDPVWDYDPAASRVSTESVEKVVDFVRQNGLNVHYILDTHAHADHLSGAAKLKKYFPNAPVGIGSAITEVQRVFKEIYHLPDSFPTDGRQFDRLLKDGDVLNAGSLSIRVYSTPGHTPACSSYLIGDALFTGDALFMPDYGTGRCDFPTGSAENLYTSVHDKLYALPEDTRVFVGHDYQPNGRELAYESTIGDEKKSNIHLRAATSREEYVAFRTQKDKGLSAPRLLLPSIQVNINGGHLPEPEKNGVSYLKIPVRT